MADPSQATQPTERMEAIAQVLNDVKRSPREIHPSPFEPVNIADVRRVGGRDKRRDETKSVRSEAHEPHQRDGDNYSDIPDGIQQDLGSGIFITYFLHALEVERLIMINKDQLEEAMEMDSEIQALEKALMEQKDKHNHEVQELRYQLEKAGRDQDHKLLEAKQQQLDQRNSFEERITRLEEQLQAKDTEVQTLRSQGGLENPEVRQTIERLESAAREASAKQVETFQVKLAEELQMNSERLKLQHNEIVEQVRSTLLQERETHFKGLKALHERELADSRTRATTLESHLDEARSKIGKLEEEVLSLKRQAQQRLAEVEIDKGSVERWPGSSVASPREHLGRAEQRWPHQLPASDFKSVEEGRINRDVLATPSQSLLPDQGNRPAYRPLMSGGARSRGCSSEVSERGDHLSEVRSADHALDSRSTDSSNLEETIKHLRGWTEGMELPSGNHRDSNSELLQGRAKG